MGCNALCDLAIVSCGAMHNGTWQLLHGVQCIMGPGNCFMWCNALWDLVIVSRGAMHYGTWQLLHGHVKMIPNLLRDWQLIFGYKYSWELLKLAFCFTDWPWPTKSRIHRNARTSSSYCCRLLAGKCLEIWSVNCLQLNFLNLIYLQTSNIRHTKFPNLNVSHLVSSLPNPLKPGVKGTAHLKQHAY